MADNIQFKRGTAARWAEVNPILAVGEPGFVYGNNKLKIGDGVTPWNSLPYIEGATGIETYSTYDALPLIGNPSTLYRVTDNKKLYQYNTATGKYESLSSGVDNIEIIHGGTP